MLESDEVARLREETDMQLQGFAHLFCALATALEQTGALVRDELQREIEGKVHWLAHHEADIHIATPLLLVQEWLTSPPPDPSDPFDGGSRPRHLRLVKK